MSWVGHVTRVGESTSACMALEGNLRERNHLEDVGLYGRIIRVKNRSSSSEMWAWNGLIWLRVSSGLCRMR